MSAEHIVVPCGLAELVERYVDKALANAREYENSSPLDESGVFELHRLAAKIYTAGFGGDIYANERRRSWITLWTAGSASPASCRSTRSRHRS